MEKEDAVYARQSVNREDSISIEGQIELCEFETRGRHHRVYIDKGFSGKNTDRPQFQEMMEAVTRGEIKRIICYKLDRCSRSVRDFVSMMEVLQQYDVEFLSCTEKFDTSTPMGRAMLNICVVFAQLERETIQMRVDDAYRSMSQKGFYMGGRIPYGFWREPYLIDGKRTKRYIANEEEAFSVRLIYATFQEEKASTGDVISVLNNCSIKNPQMKDGSWSKGRITGIICNPIYVQADISIYTFFKENGAIIHNPPEDFDGINGCYLYEDKSEGNPTKRTRIQGHHLVLAPHEGLIPSDIWLRCRKKIQYSGDTMRDNSIKTNWLSRKIKCGKCGYALIVRSVPKKPDRNYVCSRSSLTNGICEGVGKLKAETLEHIVLTEMRNKLRKFSSLPSNSQGIVDPQIMQINASIDQIQSEIDALVQNLMAANAVLAKYINERITLLDKKKTLLVQELHSLQNRAAKQKGDQHIIKDYMARWNDLDISDKMKVIDALIKEIRVTESKIQIEWKI